MSRLLTSEAGDYVVLAPDNVVVNYLGERGFDPPDQKEFVSLPERPAFPAPC